MSAPLSTGAIYKLNTAFQWQHGGHYFCYGSIDYGVTHFMDIAKLHVSGKFSIKLYVHESFLFLMSLAYNT